MRFASRSFGLSSKAFIASLLACLVLLLDAMAVSPSLHELFHADAGKAEHQCVVTLFAHGQVDSASVEVTTLAPLTAFAACPVVKFSAFSPAIANLPAGRAPPVSSANS